MSEDLIDVQIDGEWHRFPKGTRMIEACRLAGVEVPHYCYHQKLSSPGNCRMCLVQMGMPPRPAPGQDPPEPDAEGHVPTSWMPRPVIACANTIAPNMGIRTTGELTESCREGVMEFLLANHPLDCPICDQAGECSLQEFSVEHGKGESRFRERKVKKPKNVKVGPRIRLDDERCIMCSRCIRFMDEVADDPVLGFTDRGSHTVLTVHPDRELDNNYSLNTADICPVGALTSNDFRFQMRAWFMKETNTIDTNCGTGINITVSTRQGEIYRIEPRRNNDVNSDWMPDSHRLNFHWINSDIRLTDPTVKENGKHRIARYQEAIVTAADRLRNYEAGEIAIIASGRMTNEELYMAGLLKKQLGVKDIDIIPRRGESDNYLISEDRNPNTNGVKSVLGIKDPGASIDAIKRDIASRKIKALVLLQENPVTEGSFSAEELKPLEFFVTSYPLANPTADLADVVFPGACWAEKSGTMINVAGRLQRLNKVVDGPGQTLEPWEILRDLTQAMGGGNGIYSSADIFNLLTKDVADFSGLKLSDIGDLGIPFLDTGVTIPVVEREKERIARGEIVGG
ncbi:MAG: molybdopterin-dependent oxidoreductase [Verrucomicrobiales bacterium]|nr:molybdopterin-dependent oxidoreductase [Verrucomicrobiales bacterium]